MTTPPILVLQDIQPDNEAIRKIEMLERARDAQQKRVNLAEALSSFINGADTAEIVALANDLARDHRTLVQRKFSFFLTFAKVLADADKTGNYDARNEYAVKTSTQIMKIVNGISEVPNV
jgi:hypothetical protein